MHAIFLIILEKQMGNNYAPCFNRVDFVVIPSYIELHSAFRFLITVLIFQIISLRYSKNDSTYLQGEKFAALQKSTASLEPTVKLHSYLLLLRGH